ncbi:MAG TPA: bifunctional diguanylate cyclase/phosphodiesterase [Gemmatimonadaceae bacterium]|nr:bifunctional diguanylate cyclase/phosphodiesterase [Gemmatimonadaceae bacterium]
MPDIRTPAAPATPLTGEDLPLLPRESLDRAAALVAAALGCDAGPLGTKVGDNGVHVIVTPAEGLPGPVFLEDAARANAEIPVVAAARYAGARGYAAIPLVTRPIMQAGAEMTPVPVRDLAALCIVSDVARQWAVRERKILGAVAAMIAAELDVRRLLAESRAVEEELRRPLLRDPLTGLANRALFLERLTHAVERAKRHKDFKFAVLALDLDRFKLVNNSYGTDVGDEVLNAVARRIEQCIRGEDMAARVTADEYAVLLESINDDSDGGRVAERIRQALSRPVETTEGDVYTSASIGIVLSTSGLEAPQVILQRAGIAVSRAKAAGRRRYEMFDRAMQARAVARLRTETDLRHAVERGEFELYFQPLVSLESGRITELEALLRWRHPERGIVPPLEFIPLAEETGLIIPIGSWALAAACRQMVEWQKEFKVTDANGESPLALSVNLSVKQLNQPGFVKLVNDTVRAAGMDPRALKLEITESFMIDDPEGTRATLEELRNLGVKLYLDDFGAGYSSLAYLHTLPLDAIKIDRGFVSRMGEGAAHYQLVHTIRDLARNIGVLAVAEGIETLSQLSALRALGCESAQGYLFSKPVPPLEIEQLLKKDPRW